MGTNAHFWHRVDNKTVNVARSCKVNSDQSSESQADHSLEPIVTPLGDFSTVEPNPAVGPSHKIQEMMGNLRADTNHIDQKQFATPSSNQNQSTLQNSRLKAFVFRVECPGSPPQRLQLTGDLYTLGTADGCSIRLRDTNVLPLHATLRQTSTELAVEAHTDPIIVNGHAIDSTTLQVGDILTLGGYRFELISNRILQNTSAERPTLTNALPADLEKAIAGSTGEESVAPSGSSANSANHRNLQHLVAQTRLDDCSRREKLLDKREAKIEDDLASLKFREDDLSKRLARQQAEEAAALELYDQLAKGQSEILSLRKSIQDKQTLHLQREAELQNAIVNFEKALAEQRQSAEKETEKCISANDTIATLQEELEGIRKELFETQQDRDLIELREQLQRREHEILVRQLEEDRDRVIAERAENQAQLRRMEDNVRDIESMVSSAKSLDRESVEECSTAEKIDNNPPNANHAASDSTLDGLDRDSLQEYADLSKKNTELLAELIELKRERDSARDELSKSVPIENVSKLENELASASSELKRTRADFEEAVTLLETMKKHRLAKQTPTNSPESSNKDINEDSAGDSFGHSESVDFTESVLDQEQEPKRVGASWNSLINNLGETPLRESAAKNAEDNAIEQVISLIEDADEPANLNPETASPQDGWFQPNRANSIKGDADRITMAHPSVSSTRPDKQITSDNDETLFISKSQVAVAKTTSEQSSNLSQPKEVLWHGKTSEALISRSPSDSAEMTTESLSVEHQSGGDTTGSDTTSDDVEKQLDRILKRAEQIREKREESFATGLSETEPSETEPVVTSESSGSQSTILNQESTLSELNQLLPANLGEGRRKDAGTSLLESAVILRYLFALTAVVAGVICYRLVPGGIRYGAVAMALVLAAIYANEGLGMSRSRAHR